MIGEIEMGEGLPHPMLDGEWLKASRKAVCSYMISEFAWIISIKCSLMQKEAFLSIIGPFDTWGHFELRKSSFLREIRL